jgi:hypothetical protein
MKHVNTTMKIINDLTDDIYESMADNDTASLNKSISVLMAVLRDIQQSNKEEL